MDLTNYFKEYDRKISTKLRNIYLSYLKHEYDLNPNKNPEYLVSRFLQRIELPKETFPIILIPSFQTIVDLYEIAKKIWNRDLKYFPTPDIDIKEKSPCTSTKMINYASFLLNKANINIKLEGMSYQEISTIIDNFKDQYEGSNIG